MMKPIYLDLHIHTSDDPNKLNNSYNIDTLVRKIKEKTNDGDYLISLTDHNTINKNAYLDGLKKGVNLIIGAEIHIKNYDDKPPYHCHIYFDKDISEENIDDINKILDNLYKNKVITPEDTEVPKIVDITNNFEKYDFLLLPHGGQSHGTFDKSISKDVKFDNTMERGVYYNFFDGFTARSNSSLESIKKYFQKLGINEFVNLVTSTDNYNPNTYPSTKSGGNQSEFIPTWMFATPNFSGLRLALSESSRLEYSLNKPKEWTEFIEKAQLKKDYIDIDVELKPGLNVVIGGSSSGKTLFIDSLYKKINKETEFGKYDKFYEVRDLEIKHPKETVPHYIEQNFITSTITSDKLEDIKIIKKIFPENNDAKKKIESELQKLKKDLDKLFNLMVKIEVSKDALSKINALSSLISIDETQENVIDPMHTSLGELKNMKLSKHEKDDYVSQLEEIEEVLEENPFIDHDDSLVKKLKEEIGKAHEYDEFEIKINEKINESFSKYKKELEEQYGEGQENKEHFASALEKMKDFYIDLQSFDKILEKISTYSIPVNSNPLYIAGYTLEIENNFKLDKNILMETFNEFLKKDNQLKDFSEITWESLLIEKMNKNNAANYNSLKDKIYSKFEENKKTTYNIINSEGINYKDLSPGLKTSAILELILNYEDDHAPLIIDQPEDNLATSYMNDGLVKAIKNIKSKKQIILVSHNATIPMSGDAQNIIFCENIDKKIIIKSAPMEGKIGEKNVLDIIAEITDGGKPAIKKRFRKYNLKKFI